ncbi:hypothetical protein AV530_020123 [Patagioenas fasciata monilis]|uniref:Uncharacterized protein n=1 Tax=Patagioenas fasciata monilis TaxID=372326 RepID=A0A1V4JIF2_PATFA|nr:hypothetical protein AV530_020123 [Patagioenas fasciata monilis]
MSGAEQEGAGSTGLAGRRWHRACSSRLGTNPPGCDGDSCSYRILQLLRVSEDRLLLRCHMETCSGLQITG